MSNNTKPDPETVQQAADLRVRGATWDAVGAEVGRSASTVRRWATVYAREWAAAMRHAQQQLAEEAVAESVLTLRRHLRSDDDKASRAAAESLLKHTQTKSAKRGGPPRRTRRGVQSRVRQVAEFVEGLSDEQTNTLLRELADQPAAPASESGHSAPSEPSGA